MRTYISKVPLFYSLISFEIYLNIIRINILISSLHCVMYIFFKPHKLQS